MKKIIKNIIEGTIVMAIMLSPIWVGILIEMLSERISLGAMTLFVVIYGGIELYREDKKERGM